MIELTFLPQNAAFVRYVDHAHRLVFVVHSERVANPRRMLIKTSDFIFECMGACEHASLPRISA